MRRRIWLLLWLLLTVSEALAPFSSAEEAPFKIRTVQPGSGGGDGVAFTQMQPLTTGITFANTLALIRYTTNQMLLNGSGVAAGDFDGDGLTDLFFAALDRPNALYRNKGGWRFEDITQLAGVGAEGKDCMGVLSADLDNDGDLDIALTTLLHGILYYVNDGKGRFTEQAAASGLITERAGTSLAAADFDNDGDLDLYVTTYRGVTLRDQPQTNFRVEVVNGAPVIRSVNGRPTTAPDLEGRFSISANKGVTEHGEPDLFFVNLGGNRFQKHEVAGPLFFEADGSPFQKRYSWGLSVLFRDLNGDLLPDLYVCNDFETPDYFFINKGGRFQLEPPRALRTIPKFSMGADAADINADGLTDIFAVDMLSRSHSMRLTRGSRASEQSAPGDTTSRVQSIRNSLQLNRGNGIYSDIANLAGVDATEWSWTPLFLDVDLDGWEDLLVAHGYVRDDMHIDHARRNEALRRQGRLSPRELLDARTNTPPVMGGILAYRNNGDLTFSDASNQWGFKATGVPQGICLADLDDDGDMDVIAGRINDGPLLYRNNATAGRILVKLAGQTNRFGIGARIAVRSSGGGRERSQSMMTGGRYLSSDQPARVFAATAGANDIVVQWPSGKQSIATNVAPNTALEFAEASAKPHAASVDSKSSQPLFTDVSGLLNHQHTDTPFDDFERQPLLPYRLSQAGPGISLFDVNGDGWTDALIPAGAGGALAIYLNQAGKQFVRSNSIEVAATRDQNAVLGLRAGADAEIIVGQDNYEAADQSVARVVNLRTGQTTDLPMPSGMSLGALAATDMDGDGELELFAAGRTLPGRYPIASSSALFRRKAGKWAMDAAATERLANIGMVAAACWSDMDADGYPELILAMELGRIEIFGNQAGTLQGPKAIPGLSEKRGWWRSVTTADVNRDGRLEIIAGNWGRNTRYESFRTQPIRFYFAADPNGSTPFFEASFEPAKKRYAPWAALAQFRAVNPDLTQRFRSFQEFADADLQQVISNWTPKLSYLEVNTLETTLFLNHGAHFESKALPSEAQFAPVSGISATDFDGDGNEDLFFAQNLFCTHSEMPRMDAGYGLLLRGDGAGAFRAMTISESGILILGEQRGSAIGDFDRDGRPDLFVAQNSAATIALRNGSGLPGIGLRLQGPAENPDAIGARIALMREGMPLITREIRAGSGYLSQDSAQQALPKVAGADSVIVTWPGGRKSEHRIEGAEVTIKAP